ncbi:SLBB domain-containing protein [Ferrimonas aestuarii]|uniref:Sugar transporter n=1 Tax=Ferrimonas aestuarii TaxID=2569539 RepID=A0A4U1BMG9_9GAMM|nr:SLBB domain-containing protein [Ferrimonas aestuarii]TKB53935.1 sugar transporter [Ferrimonas aestuarii]
MKHNLTSYLSRLWAFVVLAVAIPAAAVNVTPQMMEQFQNLPPSQQQALAQQYGIDPSMLQQMQTQSTGQIQQPNQPLVNPVWNQQNEQFEAEKAEDELTEELKPFGYELFEGVPTTFAPVTDVPVPQDYRLGPGDTLVVQLFGKDNRDYRLQVDRQGVIQFPELGPINLSGLSFEDAKALLVERVSRQMIGQSVYVSMGELRSIRIFVAGDANNPGSYTVSSLSSASQALFVAGGIKEIGSLRNIQVKRAGKLVGHFDVYDLLMRGDASGDVPLQSGDVVFIPPVGATVAVEGDVRRPAIYELVGNETMSDLVSMAGGLKPGAYPKASVVERFNSAYRKQAVNVDLTSQSGLKAQAKDGDRLLVRSTNERFDETITIMGAVSRPGVYQWQQGQRVSDLLPSLRSDLRSQAFVDYALIIREVNFRGDIEVLGFNLAEAIGQPNSKENLTLQGDDVLMVFNQRDDVVDRRELAKFFNKVQEDQELLNKSKQQELPLLSQQQYLLQNQSNNAVARTEIAGVALNEEEVQKDQEEIEELRSKLLLTLFDNPALIKLSPQLTREELLLGVIAKLENQADYSNSSQVVGVVGEVYFPGVYPLVKNGHIDDLIAMAGGLKESAFLLQAELTRSSSNAYAQGGTEHIQVALEALLKGHNESNYALQSKDRLNIFSQPDWQENPTIELKGEVRFPGVYSIQKGETLYEVLARAGGFTDYAYPFGAVFTRESMRKQEQLEMRRVTERLRKELANRLLSESGNFASVSDTQVMLAELEKVEAVGRLVIDAKSIEQNNKKADIVVENGDLLYIPPKREIVAVMGEVQHPTSHRFDASMSLDDYLRMSGGQTERADSGRMYIVRADGSVVLPERSYWFDSEQQLKPGDTIIVPLETNYKDGLTLWSQVTSIIYNTAVALSALNIL